MARRGAVGLGRQRARRGVAAGSGPDAPRPRSGSSVTPDGVFLTSASKDGQSMLRSATTGDWVGTFQGHKGATWECALDGAALRAATASADFSARVWDAVTGDELAVLNHSHIVRSVAFAGDGASLVTGGYEKLVRVFDLNAPAAPAAVALTAPDKIRRVEFGRDGSGGASPNILYTTYIDQPGVGVWDLRAGAAVATIATPSTVVSLEVTADGGRLVTADGATARVWDAAARTQIAEFAFGFAVESASLNPAGDRIVVGGEDMWVHFLDAATGSELASLKGHHGPVHTVRWCPDGASFASGSEDGTIRIWTMDGEAKGADEGGEGGEGGVPAPPAGAAA